MRHDAFMAKTAVVSGVTSGVGWGVARGLVAKGWHVVGLARDPERAQHIHGGQIEAVRCDLASHSATEAAAAEVLNRCPKIDALIGCAGVVPWKRKENAEGVELTWATNILGHALLTDRLLDRLQASAPARVIMISGNTHRSATIHWTDPELRAGYNALRAGKQAALAKVLWTYAMARQLEDSDVTFNTFCPAFVKSGLTRDFPRWLAPLVALGHLFAQTPEEGARTPIWLATDSALEETTGHFFRHRAPQPHAPHATRQEDQDRMLALIRSGIGVGQ